MMRSNKSTAQQQQNRVISQPQQNIISQPQQNIISQQQEQSIVFDFAKIIFAQTIQTPAKWSMLLMSRTEAFTRPLRFISYRV